MVISNSLKKIKISWSFLWHTSGIHTYVSACEPVNGFSSLLLVERLLHDSCLKNSEGRSLAGVNPSAPQGGRAAEKHTVWEVRVCDFMDWRILHRQTSCAWVNRRVPLWRAGDLSRSLCGVNHKGDFKRSQLQEYLHWGMQKLHQGDPRENLP